MRHTEPDLFNKPLFSWPRPAVPVSFRMTSRRLKESLQSKNEDIGEASTANVFRPLHLQLDKGEEHTNFRQKWWQLWSVKLFYK